MKFQRIQISNTHLFWAVFIAFLFVLFPQTAWTIGQFQDKNSTQWTFMGVTASPLAWLLAGVIETTIAIVTHRINGHWMEMPKRYKADDMKGKRFSYRWLNIYAMALIVAMAISAVANYTHVVQFTDQTLKVFNGSETAVRLYQVIFGLALPGVSFVFARVLSTMQEAEQEEDPAFAKAKEDLKEANKTIRSLEDQRTRTEQSIRETEQRHSAELKEAENKWFESEQRFRAMGDLFRWVFGKDENLGDRIRGIKHEMPELSQNRIAGLVGCSVSTVNGYLTAELPESVEVQA